MESKRIAVSALEFIRDHTKVVADTGDFGQLKEFSPEDATTNPTLILQAVNMPVYASLVDDAISSSKATGLTGENLVDEVCAHLAVNFGCEILKLVPGVVSTEVDASLSFDKDGSIARAKKLISLYEEKGISRKRILIKMASTWEGCEAARELEAEGIHCNMTLLFCLAQAIAAAEAKATLISPFVGRILDWHKKAQPDSDFNGEKDPGVTSVKQIFNYFKKFNYQTIVMGASFRNIDEILCLTGCDKLTISPKLLKELADKSISSDSPVPLNIKHAKESTEFGSQINMDEKTFRWMLNEDAMATEKLAEGIRNFNKDLESLKKLITAKLE